MPHQFHDKIIPKFQDLDTEIRYMKSGAVRYALNGRSGSYHKKNKGIWENIRGTLYVPNRFLPNIGRNKCIGTITDKAEKRIIFANFNSAGYNGIYIYQPQDDGDKIIPVFLDTPDNKILDFNEYFNIFGTKSCIVNKEHLFWTDSKYKPQRYINLKNAISNKKRKWEIQNIKPLTNNNVFKITENNQEIIVFTGDSTDILKSNLNIYNYFNVKDCDCSIELEEKIPNTMDIELINISEGRVMPQNFYPLPHNERQIDLINYPPTHAPSVTLGKNTKVKRNLISGQMWQFRLKIKYKDGNTSTWGAWSKPINTSGKCGKSSNFITIDYTDLIFDTYNDATQLHLIDSVVIGYRNSNKGGLFKFIEIKQCNIPSIKQTYDFYNDTNSVAQSDYDDLKPYDAIPLKSGVLNLVDDRIVMGDNIENYSEDCFDFDLNIKYHQKDSISINKGKAIAYIYIKNAFVDKNKKGFVSQQTSNANTYYFGNAIGGKSSLDNFDQRLGEKGFIGYIAGSEIYTISKQEITGTPNINKADSDYNIVMCVTTTDKDKVSNALIANNNTFRQKLEFNGLPDGKHIIRLASHWCSFGDKLGKGNAYNMNNGIEWQKTSTNINSVNGQVAFEAEIEIVNGLMVGIPPVFIIDDYSSDDSFTVYPPSRIDFRYSLVQGYVIDSLTNSQEDIKKGTRVEYATVEVSRVDVLNIEHDSFHTYTDHNGYFHELSIVRAINTGHSRICIAKDRDSSWNTLPSGSGDMKLLWKEDNPYKGTLGNLESLTLTTFNNSTDLFPRNNTINLICPTTGSGANNVTTNYRTHIKGKLVDMNNNPIVGAIIFADKTSRFDTTDINGDFSILIYTDYTDDKANKRTVSIYSNGSMCINLKFKNTYILELGNNKYNINNDYDIGTIQVSISNNNVNEFFLKNGGVYSFGITLMDRALRKTTVLFNEKKHKIKLPFTTEYINDYFPNLKLDTNGNDITNNTKADGYFSIEVIPKDIPPIWSVSAYILRSDDEVYADYLQFVLSDVKYVVNYDTTITDGNITPTPVYTTFNSKDANEIYLNLGTSFIEYQKRNSDSKKSWTFEKGDRVRFIYNKDGQLRDFTEVEVKEQRGDWFVIPVIESLGEIFKGEVVEIFRIKQKTTNRFFYETGEFLKVLKPYTDNRAWEYPLIQLNTGDSYRRKRAMYAKDSNGNTTKVNCIIEDLCPEDSYTEKDSDKGRVDFVNTNLKQVNSVSSLRFGGSFKNDSNENNIRSFNLEDVLICNNNYGNVTVIDDFGGLLFVAQYYGCHTRGVKKTNAYLGDGQPMLLNSERFISEPYDSSTDIGCQNPESYTKINNSGRFFDAYKGLVAQYDKQSIISNISGLDDRYKSSRFQDNYIKGVSDVYKMIDLDIYPLISNIYGYANNKEKEYNITFNPINIYKGQDISFLNGSGSGANIGNNDLQFRKYGTAQKDIIVNQSTISFDYIENIWLGFRSYVAEMYAELGDNYFGFKDGNFYIMEGTDIYNNFFGVQYSSKLSIISNINPSDMKGYLAWSVESNSKWSNPRVEVLNNRAFRTQLSETPDGIIEHQNGAFYAPFLMDKNTENVELPLFNGNRLIGENIIIDIENNDSNNVLLFCVNIYAQSIPRTNY